MTASTVLPKPTHVNTLPTVVDGEAEARDRSAGAKRLRTYLLARFVELGGDGSISGLAEFTGVKRQQLHEWFAANVEPNLGSLDQLAGKLRVTRAEIVAAMDGQLPPPNWRAELDAAMKDFLASAVASGAIVVPASPQPSPQPGSSGAASPPERK